MPSVLVTGANRGLGFEFTRQYAEAGWRVIACCRAPTQADALQMLAKSQPRISIQTFEAGNAQSLADLKQHMADTPIDVLINNAGIYSGKGADLGTDTSQSFGTIEDDAWMKVLHTNTIAPIMTIQGLLPNLEKGSGKKIIDITSRMGSLTEMGSGSIAYRSSKAALNAAMRVIAHDLKEKHIAIYNLHPGWVQTDMGGKNAHLTPPQSVTAMRETIAKLKPEQTGSFLNYDGQMIPW